MDIILGISLQFLAQAVIQILFELPFDWLFFQQRKDNLDRPQSMQKFTFLICTILGLAVGAITLIILRYPLISNEWMRFLSLFITPYIVGKTVYFLHDRRTFEPERIYLFDHFWNAYIFSFGISIIRFIFL